jgi:uncharacterized protein YecE (DUF72 family)
MGWSYPDWVGPFYPPGAKAGAFLAHYARAFDCVELDTTFYGVPRPASVRAWDANTPSHFRFTAKLPKEITHEQALRSSADLLHRFLDAMSPLGEKLGPVLIQLPPDFQATAENQEALRHFVKLLPEEYQFAAEFRHRSWLLDETLDLLRQHGVAWTMIDMYAMPKRQDITSDFTYVRLLGDRRKIQTVSHIQIDRTPELQAWANVFGRVTGEVRQAWVFINNHYAGHSPANVRQLRQMLGLPPEASRENAFRPEPVNEAVEQPRLPL